MLDYQQFKEQLLHEVSKCLKGMQCGFKLEETHITTVGRERDAIIVLGVPNDISPILYLEELFADYQRVGTLNTIVEKVVNTLLEGFDANSPLLKQYKETLSDKEAIKEKIIPVLINTTTNAHLLSKVPHRKVMDLSIIYKIILEDTEIATVQITNSLSPWIEMTEDELYKAAFGNLARTFKTQIQNMRNILKGTVGVEVVENSNIMLVLKNRLNLYGAITMLDLKVMRELSEQFNSDLIVLPSSIHECIVVPSILLSIEAATQMVQAVNRTQVSPEEVLADHAYVYQRNTGILENPETGELMKLIVF